jgi:hypothetical protein
MRMGRLLAAALLAGFATTTQAAGVEVYLSNKTAQLQFMGDAGGIGLPGAEMSFGLFYSDDKDYMGTFGLKASGTPAGEQPLTFGLGGKVYIGSIDRPDQNFQALALGAEARYTIPANMPMAIAADIHFAPSVTSFGDADQLVDFGVRFELEVTPGVSGFLGYRQLTLDLDQDSSYEMDDHVHFGVRFSF